VTPHIIPWNFLISTAARGIAPALAAGCTVVAKPAEQSPFTALMLANNTMFGLVAGIYIGKFANAHRLARSLNAGQVYINEYFAGGIEVPFGGNKHSGFGREKGFEGLKSYCKTKSIAGKIS